MFGYDLAKGVEQYCVACKSPLPTQSPIKNPHTPENYLYSSLMPTLAKLVEHEPSPNCM